MNEAQKWVLGLILLILMLHWLLPSGSKPSRLSTIWKAAFTPGTSGGTAPTTQPVVNVPGLPAGMPDLPPQGTVTGNLGDATQNPDNQPGSNLQLTQTFDHTFNNPLITLLEPFNPATMNVTDVSAGSYSDLAVFGQVIPGVNAMVLNGTFAAPNPQTGTLMTGFIPQLQGRLIATPPGNPAVRGHGVTSAIMVPASIHDPIKQALAHMTPAQLAAVAKGNAIKPAGGGPNAWDTVLHGFRRVF